MGFAQVAAHTYWQEHASDISNSLKRHVKSCSGCSSAPAQLCGEAAWGGAGDEGDGIKITGAGVGGEGGGSVGTAGGGDRR